MLHLSGTARLTSDTPLHCTCFAVRRAARHVSQIYDGHLAPTGLRTTQYSLLNVLAGDGPRSLVAIAKRMGMDRTTLGRNLRPLEREGLVSIDVDPQDRRGRALAITAQGRAKLAEARACWAAAQAAFEARYGKAETRDLHMTLDAVAKLDFGQHR
ncbi:MAG: MarR family winged helix-turn-helix transcriptional regulator [Acetobacteraceae bacterium]|nr:MarR family winged helix-turn-helix transcriptional regulator [Acetobacteraceae bacterium]